MYCMQEAFLLEPLVMSLQIPGKSDYLTYLNETELSTKATQFEGDKFWYC